jgi:hypothetical protein
MGLEGESMRALSVGLLVSALLAGAAQAAPEPLVDRWSTATVTESLASLGATEVQVNATGGRPYVTARTHDGLNVAIYAKACDQAAEGKTVVTCHGLESIISFDPGRGDRAILVGRLNHEFALGKYLAEEDGTIRLSRYLVFDAGVTPGNLRSELASFFAVGVLTAQSLWPEAVKR